MMSVEEIIICILLVVIFYLYYLYKKALEANKKGDAPVYYSNTITKPSGSGASYEKGSKSIKEDDLDDDLDDVVDNYEDPNFSLPPIVPHKKMPGTVIGEFGDAIYGNEKRYYKDLYYGRVGHKAKIELVDRRVYKNQFELDIIKILVIKNEWKSEEGQIGWVGLSDTSFRNNYNPESRTIDE